MTGYIVGVDVGSQSVKVVLCSPEGEEIATAACPCAMHYPASGWAEQSPREWEVGIAIAVRRAVAEAGIVPSDVTHLGLACQVDGVVPVDGRLRPLRPAIIWLDRRATAQARSLEERLSAERIFAISGLNCDASHIVPKLMWLRDMEPDTYREARLLPPVAGYLTGWLTGVAAQDHANASSTLLYDIRSRRWCPALLEAAGIDPALLAPIVPSHVTLGRLTPAAADALGLTQRCAVVGGTGDDHAAALGAGVALPGVVVDVAGTAEPVGAVAAEPVFDPERLVETHAHAVDGMLFLENPGFVSGGSTAWLARVLGAEQERVFAWAAEAPPGADGVLFVPALSGATAPRWDDRMRGAFQGLAMNHDRAHLCRAVLEGCAFALRDIVDRLSDLGLAGPEIRVVGGGSCSALWMQIKADVTGYPTGSVLSREPTALGAAMLAAVGAGVFGDAAAAAAAMVRFADHRYEPNQACRDLYRGAHMRYRSLFDALQGVAG